MNTDSHTQAVLLLTAWFSKPSKDEPRPLTPSEWGRFAVWLKEQGILPEALLTEDLDRVLVGWQDPKITLARIRYLLGRAAALGLALERWERAGLWVLTRADSEYPSRLKQRLKTASPPLLFGCGNRRLLQQGGIAVVGSRAASEADLALAGELAKTVALQGQSIVSGGARGVDEAAMLAALAQEGTAVGVLADRLLVATTSSKYRPHLMANNLVLVSPFYPEAGFDVGNAMARNKYVYCLSDAAVVVVSNRGEGGTWNGAVENLKQGWVPLWVKPQPDPGAGNAELIRLGARELPVGEFNVALLTREATIKPTPGTTMAAEGSSSGPAPVAAVPRAETPALPQPVDSTGQGKSSLVPTTFYAYFLVRLQDATRTRAMSLPELATVFDVGKTQIAAWLKRAENEGVVEKLKKPVRYRWRMPAAGQGSLFGGRDAGLEPESQAHQEHEASID